MRLVDVYFPIPVEGPFTYLVPGSLRTLEPGMRVLAPLRGGNAVGVAARLWEGEPPTNAKEVLGALDPSPVLDKELLSLAHWLAQEYLCSPGEALFAMLPAGTKRRVGAPRTVRVAHLAVPREEALRQSEALAARAPAQAEALRRLAREGPLPAGELGSPARALERRGLVSILREEAPPRKADATQAWAVPERLSEGQARALEAIRAALDGRRYRSFLLHGVIASGKTEVYLRAAEHALSVGRGCIILVPEIALTPQTVAQVEARFPGRVALIHSAQSAKASAEAWRRLREGRARVAVGPRSAVFAPVNDLGLIVLDEENEGSYKQDETPRYHARAVALERARRCGAVVVLAGATPSLDTYHAAQAGQHTVLRLHERVVKRPPPAVEVVDMRREREAGNPGPLSRRLLELLEETLAEGGQAILFLNRRGFFTTLACRRCGEPLRCDACAITLRLHAGGGGRRELLCHYCGRTGPAPTRCPACGGGLRYLGLGSQRLAAEVAKHFPEARVARLDSDSPASAVERIHRGMREGTIDILVGTQMVAKGHHFPNVTLIGIALAEATLAVPSHRSAERTHQLIAQAAGRAGRGEKQGTVLVQTYEPDHPAIATAIAGDYDGFAREELRSRRMLGYPPFARMVSVLFRSRSKEAAEGAARIFAERLRVEEATRVLGPAPEPIPRVAGRWRWHLTLLTRDWEGTRQALREASAELRGRMPGGVQVAFDVDPD